MPATPLEDLGRALQSQPHAVAGLLQPELAPGEHRLGQLFREDRLTAVAEHPHRRFVDLEDRPCLGVVDEQRVADGVEDVAVGLVDQTTRSERSTVLVTSGLAVAP